MYRGSDSKHRRGTKYTVSFPTFPTLKALPTKLYLVQKQGHHDLLTMEFPIVSDLWFENLKTGAPVQFVWKQGAQEKFWYGYVSFTTKEVLAQRKQVMKVQCIGASFLLKQKSVQVFTDTTITDCVKKITDNFGIKLVTVPSTRKFEQLTISGHSYWEWIQEQAKRLGYAAYMDGMALHFKPLDKVIDTKANNVPILSMHSSMAKFASQDLDRTLDYIEVTQGHYIESVDSLRTNKYVSGINPFTGEVISTNMSPESVGDNLRSNNYSSLFNEYRSDIVIDNEAAAKEASEGVAHLGRFSTPARVKCQGDPRIQPYAPVLVEKTGPLTDGYWVVKDVTHIFGRTGEYQIEMNVVTDGVESNLNYTSRPGTPSRIGVIDVDDMIESGVKSNVSNNATLVFPDQITDFSDTSISVTGYHWAYRSE